MFTLILNAVNTWENLGSQNHISYSGTELLEAAGCVDQYLLNKVLFLKNIILKILN